MCPSVTILSLKGNRIKSFEAEVTTFVRVLKAKENLKKVVQTKLRAKIKFKNQSTEIILY